MNLGPQVCKLIGQRTAHSKAGHLWRDWLAARDWVESQMAKMRTTEKWAAADDEEIAAELLRWMNEPATEDPDGE